jgi:hypothetical protein
MVLSRVALDYHAADPGLAVSDQHKYILGNELSVEVIDDLNVGEPLPARAHLVLALHDVDAARLQRAPRLGSASEIQVENRLMVFERSCVLAVVFVVLLKVLMSVVGGTARRMHVRWVKYDAVQRFVFVGQFRRIDTLPEISSQYLIQVRLNVLPKYALSKKSRRPR